MADPNWEVTEPKLGKITLKWATKLNFNGNFIVLISFELQSWENMPGQTFSGRKSIRNTSVN